MGGRGGQCGLLFFLFLVSCGDDKGGPGGGADAAGQADAAVEADAGQPDAGGEPRTVTGSAIDIHVADDGEALAPIDLSDALIEVLVDDGAGGFLRLPGAGLADGTFTVADVPAGSYMLRVGNQYFVTSRSSIDLGHSRLGRAGAASATISPTRLRWLVDQLDAWQVDDRLDFFAPNAGASFIDLEDETATPPLESDVSIAMGVDFTDAIEPKLVDAAAGDVGYLLHISFRGADPALVLTQIFQPGPFTMVDGQRTRLTGSFADVALDRSVEIDLRTSDFAALTADLSAGTAFSQQASFHLYTSPFAIDRGDLGFIALAEYFAPDLEDRTVSIDYGHPFPADWTPYALADFFVFSAISEEPFTVGVGVIGAIDTVEGLSDQPITVRLGPVENPTVDGADATQPATAGSAPLIAWDPPATGTAEIYRVLVHQVTDATPRGPVIASFTTPDTSVRIPDGVLTPGQTYFIEIDAEFNPDVDLVSAPFQLLGPRRTVSRRPTAPIEIE